MKKKVLLALLAPLVVAVYLFPRKAAEVSIPEPTVLGKAETYYKEVSFEGQDYWVYLLGPVDGGKISLIPNFREKLTSEEIMRQNNCMALVNGGFYTEDNKPVGYFKSNNSLERQANINRLFNSFFSINDFATPRITRELPLDQLALGIQLGPLLVENSKYQTLSVINDKPARRMVLLVDGHNKVYFLGITGKGLQYSGPNLNDLPFVLNEWENLSQIKVADAVNLDGGSASALRTQNFVFTEISPIGSAFCIKYD